MIKAIRNRVPKLSAPKDIHTCSINNTDISDSYSYSRPSSSSSSNWSIPITPPPTYISDMSACNSDDVDCSKELSVSSGFNKTVQTECGIRHKFASQGLTHLNLSALESQSNTAENDSGTPSLTRQLYVHGAIYILHGLPTDLSGEEILSIWSACPGKIRDIALLEASKRLEQQQQANIVTNLPSNRKRQSQQEISILHRVLAVLIVQIFLLVQFFAPYLKTFLSNAYAFERRNRISERSIKSGVQIFDGLIKFGDSVCRMNEGRVGIALQEIMIWWIVGISGGVQEGVGKGLHVLGLEINTDGEIMRKNSP